MPAIKVLMLAQLPPPVHGVTVTTSRVKAVLEEELGARVEHVWQGGAQQLTDIERKSVAKLVGFARLNAALGLRALRRFRSDIVYVTLAPWADTAIRDALLAWWGKRLGKRTLVHLHGEGLENVLAATPPLGRLIRSLIAGTELIAITGKAAGIAERSGIFARVHRLANVAPDPGRDVVTAARERPLRLGYIANLDPRKGAMRFVETFDGLSAAGLSLQGDMAGGSTRSMTTDALKQELEARGLSGRIRVHGAVEGAGKAEFFKAVDVLVYLSSHDHAPLVLVEALSYGVVPIVLDTGGIAEMMGADFAGHVLPADIGASAQLARIRAIVTAYVEDPSRLAAHRRLARARYEADFNEARFARDLAAIMASTVTGAPGETRTPEPAGVRSAAPKAIKARLFAWSRAAHARLQPGRLPARIAVYFHSLEAEERRSLAECVAALRERGYRSVGIDQYLDARTKGPIFHVSFDDNFRSWHEALGELDRLDLRATFYTNSLPLIDDAAETNRAYAGRIGARAPVATLSRSELAEIAGAGHEIGCHSHSHFMMASLPRQAWALEVRQSKALLEDVVGREVRHFSWPYGMPRHFSRELRAYCFEAGFRSIAAATPCMLHAGVSDTGNVPRSAWRSDRSTADNLVDLALDGRLFTRLTGLSIVG